MTTGSTSSGTMPNRKSRGWSGTNGKYTIINGSRAVKFNTYDNTVTEHTGNMDSKYGIYYMNIAALPSAAIRDTGNDTIKALSKLAAKARGHDFHAGKFIAEGRQAVEMAVNGIQSVAGCINSLHNAAHWEAAGNRKAADIFFRDAHDKLGIHKDNHSTFPTIPSVANMWLQLQYGWMPLISDVHEAAKALAVIADPPRVSIIRSSTNRFGSYDSSASPANYTGKGTYRIKVQYLYEMREQITAQRALGLQDPAGIAWEVVPYSFVVDWFLPIGTYLDALAVIPKLTTGRWCKTTGTLIVSSSVPTKLSGIYYSGCHSSFTAKIIKRETGTGFSNRSIPAPSFKSFDQAMSGSHVFAAAALATQLMHKILKVPSPNLFLMRTGR